MKKNPNKAQNLKRFKSSVEKNKIVARHNMKYTHLWLL